MAASERESLAEDVLLLAIHNEHGTAHVPEKRLRSALASAVVMDLLLRGRIATADGHVIVVDRSPMDDPVCDRALACIATTKSRPALSACAATVGAAMPEIEMLLLDRLVARGVVAREKHRALGIVPMKDRFPERDDHIAQDLRAHLRAVALYDKKPDARTTILAALIVGLHLEGGLFNERERDVAVAQLRDIARGARERSAAPATMTPAGIDAGAHIAGEDSVTGGGLMDALGAIDWDGAFELVFEVIPGIFGALFDALSDS